MNYWTHLYLCFLLLVLYSTISAEQINVKWDSTGQPPVGYVEPIGRILVNKSMETRIGTGFYAGRNYSIFTVAHVALRDTMYFLSRKSDSTHKIFLSYKSNGLDAAIYERVTGRGESAYELGDFHRLRAGEKIMYIGFSGDYSLQYGQSTIVSKGEMINNDRVVDFIEFKAKGVLGLSGSPVFDVHGQVVAIITLWIEHKGSAGVEPSSYVRAFSIDTIRQIENYPKRNVDSTNSSNDH